MPNRHSFRSLFIFMVLLAGLALVGCSDDETTTADITETDPTGGDGDVFVEAGPTELNVPWTLTLPGGESISGENNYHLRGQVPGDYTISWPQLDGWNEPRPSTLQQTLDSGSNLIFSAIYLPQPGTTLVSVQPVGLDVNWRMLGPEGFDLTASGDTTLVNLVPGSYGVEWFEVEGFDAPDSLVVSLSALLPMYVVGQYSFPDSTLLINPVPEETDAGWTLEGPNGFGVAGNGRAKVDIKDSGNGLYTVTWNDVDQYTKPEPGTLSVHLEKGLLFTINGTYIPLEGSINLNAVLGETDLPWTLTGPTGTVQYGSGTTSMSGMRPGTYSVQGLALDGWVPADGSSQDLPSAGDITFTISAEAAITVRPLPMGLDAAWQLTGPDGYSLDGTGEMLVDGLDAGSYTITWTDITGWSVPAASSQTLAADHGLVFEGQFEQGANTLHVNPKPATETITWDITGPGGYSESGTGMTTLSITEDGDYTITWGAVAGYMQPAPSAATFSGDNNLVFSTRYVELLDLVSLSAGSFSMGSGQFEGCRSGFEFRHTVNISRDFIMKATEVTNGEYIAMAQWAYDNGYVTADRFGVNDNLDGSTVELLDLDDGDQEIFFEAGLFSTPVPDQPVKEVSWYGAASYCDWLSMYRGLEPAYSHITWVCGINHPASAAGFRLPTEAEWEYACRAGSGNAYANNIDILELQEDHCISPDLDTICWYDLGSGGWSQEVGQLVENTWGLFDMHGNVREWVNDWMRPNYYNEGPPAEDPPGPLFGTERIIRGGYFFSPAKDCRSAARSAANPSNAAYDTGFRVVLSGN